MALYVSNKLYRIKAEFSFSYKNSHQTIEKSSTNLMVFSGVDIFQRFCGLLHNYMETVSRTNIKLILMDVCFWSGLKNLRIL